MKSSTPLELRLDATEATHNLVGGKGKSLARLARMGLPVPPGFHLTTAAYRRFVEANDMQPAIMGHAAGPTDDNLAALEHASAAIQGLFEAGVMPDEVATAIRQAYAELEGDDSSARPPRRPGRPCSRRRAGWSPTSEASLPTAPSSPASTAFQPSWALATRPGGLPAGSRLPSMVTSVL